MVCTMSDETAAAAPDPFAQAEASARALLRITGRDSFDTVVVLGSGWLAAADAIGAAEREVSVEELGGFSKPSVKGHTPSVRYLKKGDLHVLLYLGRIHLY